MALRVDEEYSWESSQNQVLTHLQFIINSFSNDFWIAVVSSVLNLVQLDPPHLVIVHPNFLYGFDPDYCGKVIPIVSEKAHVVNTDLLS